MARLTVQMASLLLVMSVLVCDGLITGPGGCTTTCCMTCQLGDNCEICYKLNPPSLNCPCLHSLNKAELKRLIQLRGARTEAKTEAKTEAWTETRIEARTKARTEAKTEARTETKIEARTEASTEKKREEGSCLPLCCPFPSCSSSSCPLCYRRHRQNREKCPCSKW